MKKSPTLQYHYESDVFNYSGKQTKLGWKFTCSVSPTEVNTREFPQTLSIIQSSVPGVLTTECFNEYGLSFDQEITQTEIGHLFEHILIYFLKEAQLQLGMFEVVYEGNTSWNWQKNPRGVFHIKIWGPQMSSDKFVSLLQQATLVIEKIMKSPRRNAVNATILEVVPSYTSSVPLTK